jgi:hypothetical protein
MGSRIKSPDSPNTLRIWTSGKAIAASGVSTVVVKQPPISWIKFCVLNFSRMRLSDSPIPRHNLDNYLEA